MGAFQLSPTISFICVLLASTAGGSISTFPLYGPCLLTVLHYTQAELNVISTGAMISTYLLSPAGAYLCRRTSPRFTVFVCSCVLSGGYYITALACSTGADIVAQHASIPFWTVAAAHVFIGGATSTICISAFTACAMNTRFNPRKGVLMSIPVAMVSIGGVGLSQLGARVFMTRGSLGRDEVLDVTNFLTFLSILIFLVGVTGLFGLHVHEPIEEDVYDTVPVVNEEPEVESSRINRESQPQYGTISHYHTDDSSSGSFLEATQDEDNDSLQSEPALSSLHMARDQSLWWLGLGIILIPGPIAVYMNNLSAIITAMTKTTNPSPAELVASNVTIISITASVTRLSLGALSDCVAPSPRSHFNATKLYRTRFLILLIPALSVVLGYLLLAVSQSNPLSALALCSALLGIGGGCGTAVNPIVAQAWGPDNFALISGWIGVAPAVGIAIWAWLYSLFYGWAVSNGGDGGLGQCFGWRCYGPWALLCVFTAALGAFSWGLSWLSLRHRGIVV